VITDGDRVVHESGAIIDYIIRRHGGGKLAPALGSDAYETYNQWLHYAEGSAMLPLLLFMYVSRLGEAGQPLHARIDSEIANHMGYVNSSLEGRDWLLGEFSAADVQMSFVGEILKPFGRLDAYPNIKAWVKRFQARPAYQAALEKGGAYSYGSA
jgi:glutathione S-transferase